MSGTGLLAAVCGALLVGGLVLAAHALTAPDAPTRSHRRRPRLAAPADPSRARRQRVLRGAAAGVAARQRDEARAWTLEAQLPHPDARRTGQVQPRRQLLSGQPHGFTGSLQAVSSKQRPRHGSSPMSPVRWTPARGAGP